jgi:hypothetical protein
LDQIIQYFLSAVFAKVKLGIPTDPLLADGVSCNSFGYGSDRAVQAYLALSNIDVSVNAFPSTAGIMKGGMVIL